MAARLTVRSSIAFQPREAGELTTPSLDVDVNAHDVREVGGGDRAFDGFRLEARAIASSSGSGRSGEWHSAA